MRKKHWFKKQNSQDLNIQQMKNSLDQSFQFFLERLKLIENKALKLRIPDLNPPKSLDFSLPSNSVGIPPTPKHLHLHLPALAVPPLPDGPFPVGTVPNENRT